MHLEGVYLLVSKADYTLGREQLVTAGLLEIVVLFVGVVVNNLLGIAGKFNDCKHGLTGAGRGRYFL
jgi:hypothetical protein